MPGSGPTAVPIATRVMQGVSGAGMDIETGFGGIEVNGQREEDVEMLDQQKREEGHGKESEEWNVP